MANIQKSIVLGVVINSEGKLLIGKRKDLTVPDADGFWEILGGHIEFGEDPEDAIIREIKEESGLEIEVIKLLPKIYFSIWQTKDGDKWQTLFPTYLCKVTGGSLHTKNFDKKITELKFISKSEINNYKYLPNVIEIFKLLDS